MQWAKWREKDNWNIIWSRPYINYRKHHELFWELSRDSSFGSVLDLGCGPACIWEGTNFSITGLDFSEDAITQARINNPKGRFIRASLDEKLPLDEKFDTIVLCGVVNYFPDFTNIISEVKRLSHEGSRILITINDMRGLNKRLWTEDEVLSEFAKWGSSVDATFYPKIGWFIIIVV